MNHLIMTYNKSLAAKILNLMKTVLCHTYLIIDQYVQSDTSVLTFDEKEGNEETNRNKSEPKLARAFNFDTSYSSVIE